MEIVIKGDLESLFKALRIAEQEELLEEAGN
jgi:hypothetical protein